MLDAKAAHRFNKQIKALLDRTVRKDGWIRDSKKLLADLRPHLAGGADPLEDAGLLRELLQTWLYDLSDALAAAGTVDEALEINQLQAELFPDEISIAHAARALLLLQAGRKEEAIALAEENVRQHPGNEIVFMQAGKLYESLERWADAEQLYRQLLVPGSLVDDEALMERLQAVLARQGPTQTLAQIQAETLAKREAKLQAGDYSDEELRRLFHVVRFAEQFPRRELTHLRSHAARVQSTAVTELLEILRYEGVQEGSDPGPLLAMLLLAEAHVTDALELVIGIVHLPEEDLELLFGDLYWEFLPRILAALVGDKRATLLDLARDPKVAEDIRGLAISTLVVMVHAGSLSRDAAREEIRALFATPDRTPSAYWFSLVNGASTLRLEEFIPEIKQAYADGLLDVHGTPVIKLEEILEEIVTEPDPSKFDLPLADWVEELEKYW